MPQEPQNKEVEEHIQSAVEEAKQQVTASRTSSYHRRRIARMLLGLYALQLTLFAVLAWWVHYHPILPVDVAITREFQENSAPWLKIAMIAVSYPGSTFILPALILLTALIFWLIGLRLEAVFVIGLSVVSTIVNFSLKLLVERPRPKAGLIDVFQGAAGGSFPSGHVMEYLAFWGLLFSFTIILFTGVRWWRILLLVISALFIVLIGPARVYLVDHWASDVLGSYLIGGVLLGI